MRLAVLDDLRRAKAGACSGSNPMPTAVADPWWCAWTRGTARVAAAVTQRSEW